MAVTAAMKATARIEKEMLERAQRPNWESRNEGIHERVNFDDTIWGFNLAGGAFYKTPLRVTGVKRGSRAEKAGIRPGDKLIRINDLDSSTLTLQEAHDMILESGVWIRLAVSAPEDTDTTYNCYQDEYDDAAAIEAERLRLEEEKRRKRKIVCKTNSNWSLAWPWVSKRRIIYKESNCYLVPSKYEGNHKEKFSLPEPEPPKDLVLHPKDDETKQERVQTTTTTSEVIEEEEMATTDARD